ncbi:universal stress protein [Amphritea opalescens]|uniref:Universal stress protein n=1 Tax=Amphritea opalescens TaxID=2490544 RepID=A0A430KP28_9GAMM|nr:universal stress protein [Amphritea opalescens]RTE65247.1 universal stress protein [Amphritea opalescens]
MALPEIKTILYTTSLGKHTRPVFRQALNLAQNLNARIIMLHVIEPIGELGHALIQNYLPEETVKKMHDEGIDEVMKQMKSRIEKFCEEELGSLDKVVDLDIEHMIVEGNYTDSILKTAASCKADMIIMGSENTFGHHSQTTRQVIKGAKVPVVAVPTGKKYI